MKANRFALALVKRAMIASAVIIMTLVMIQCDSTPKYTDPAQNLLAQSVKALGGEKKARAWTTRIDKGVLSAERPGWGNLQADCTVSIKKPDKMKFDQDYSAYDHPFFYTFYCNGGDVWVNVNLGIRQHPRYTKIFQDRMRRIDGPAYFLTECDTFFLVPEVPDDSLITASSIDRIGVVDMGDTVLFDIDKQTHLPVRRIQDGGTTVTLFEDYRNVSGIKLPFKEDVIQNGAWSSYQWQDIEINPQIDNAIFEEDRPKQQEETE